MKEQEIKAAFVEDMVAEINEVPFMYLKTLKALIHAFKENISSLPAPTKETEEDFDWEEMLSEIHQRRQENNKIQFGRMDNLFTNI